MGKYVRKADRGLRFVGDRPFRGVPARNLTAADLRRLAYRRQMAEIGADGRRPDPVNPPKALVEQIRAELVGSGLYKPEG